MGVVTCKCIILPKLYLPKQAFCSFANICPSPKFGLMWWPGHAPPLLLKPCIHTYIHTYIHTIPLPKWNCDLHIFNLQNNEVNPDWGEVEQAPHCPHNLCTYSFIYNLCCIIHHSVLTPPDTALIFWCKLNMRSTPSYQFSQTLKFFTHHQVLSYQRNMQLIPVYAYIHHNYSA